jgi:hypothetical protein
MMKSNFRRWGTVSSAWLEHPAIGIDEYAVLSYLATYMAPDGSGIEPSQNEIARNLKVSRARVNRILGRLAELGILEKRRQYQHGAGETNCRYCIQINADGKIVAAGAPVPSVMRQICGEPSERVSQSETPPSQTVTSPVMNCDTNQDSKIPNSPSSREEAGNDWHGRERRGREGVEHAEAEPSLVDELWVPTAGDIAWAGAHCPGLDILHHTQEYITGCRSKRRMYHDHSAAWRNWALKDWCKPKSRDTSPARQGRRGAWRRTDSQKAPVPSLAERNRSAADACLERINRRRGIES